MGQFSWLGRDAEPPFAWDLRRVGWTLVVEGRGCNSLLCDGHITVPRHLRGRSIVVGIDDSSERARLIEAGFADAVPHEVSMIELSLRVSRAVINQARMPRLWRIGPLVLDLMHRDAQVGERWLALTPREFELIWRLAEARGQRVARSVLLRDVWRLTHDPGTNSVEVHVARIRAKLARMRLAGVIVTHKSGGYSLRTESRGLFGQNSLPDLGRYVMAAG